MALSLVRDDARELGQVALPGFAVTELRQDGFHLFLQLRRLCGPADGDDEVSIDLVEVLVKDAVEHVFEAVHTGIGGDMTSHASQYPDGRLGRLLRLLVLAVSSRVLAVTSLALVVALGLVLGLLFHSGRGGGGPPRWPRNLCEQGELFAIFDLEIDAHPTFLWTLPRHQLVLHTVALDLHLLNGRAGVELQRRLGRGEVDTLANDDAALVRSAHDRPPLRLFGEILHHLVPDFPHRLASDVHLVAVSVGVLPVLVPGVLVIGVVGQERTLNARIDLLSHWLQEVEELLSGHV
mmetsp:Transcript_44034/g.93720  ORF Transcript_44034/g.93720 Transcript_44034/m.93720 type:complete len:293 (+) Transcript_44034:115-993(+)